MAEKLCELRKKGGGAKYTETVLWTNPNPNTRMPASDSTISANVTLSDALSNYDYVKFKFKRNNSAYADSYTDVIYSVEEFKKYLASTAYAFRGSVSAFTNNTNIQITKKFSYVDDTTVMFVHTMSGTNSAGSYTQIIYDETLIPNQIVGIKQHGTIKPQTTDLSSPPNAVYTNASMANNATDTLAVTQTPKYIIICMNGQAASYNYGTLIINVEDNTAYMIGYWSNTFQNQDYSTNWTDFITSVSDSSISIKNAWGSTVRMDLCVYY